MSGLLAPQPGASPRCLEQGAGPCDSDRRGPWPIRQVSSVTIQVVTSIESLNSRDLTADHLKHKIEFIVCDVSFISLKLALPAALSIAESGARLIALIKPQFEAGRDAVGRGGIVSDPQEHDRVCKGISEFLAAENWKVSASPHPQSKAATATRNS